MDLQWTPKKAENLIAWAQHEIFLHQIDVSDCEDSTYPICVRISDPKSPTIIGKINDFPLGKVVDIYPGPGSDTFAVGLANGKVVLTSFGSAVVHREFVPKHSRPVNSISWNKHCSNLLAAGFEKARSEAALLIWDVGRINGGGSAFHSEVLRPTIEVGPSEVAHSLAWVSSKSLLVGMNSKHIKLFDLRDSSPKVSSSAATKAVYGIVVDGGHRAASFSDNQVYVWDMRNFDKPFIVLNNAKAISKIAWCPTRGELLGSLEREANYITLYDVHHAALSTEEGEPAVLERRIQPLRSESTPLVSFAWHPTKENLLTTLTTSGLMCNSIVYERITLNWSSQLVWSDGKKTIQFIDNSDTFYEDLDDISMKIKRRALAGYGLKVNLKDNGAIVSDDKELSNLWDWLDFCKTLTESQKCRLSSVGSLAFPGARAALRMDSYGPTSGALKSEFAIQNQFELHGTKTYRSDERSFVQQLCGWTGNDSNDGTVRASRRAAVALFHLKLRHAIRILSDSEHAIVAMAIAGFNDDRNSLWRENVSLNSANLRDPYIRAIFTFLTEPDSNFDSILNDRGISVGDRIGFACSFLSDIKLVAFLDELTTELVKEGDLNGILLTGMTPAALPLLQKYLNKTGDVQTLAILAIRTMAADIPTTQNLKLWIDRYQDLLNSWKLWEQRAEFDIVKNKNNTTLIPHPEVVVSCNFCGKSISPASSSSLARNTQFFSRFTTTNARLKLSSCPSCRKPLPRCAICLLHMGTLLGSGGQDPIVLGKSGTSPEALAWYTWCQTCRHGGHTMHLQLWFKSQSECPVTGCNCKCASLDKIIDFPT